jgi:hypothetical protein
MKFRIIHSNDKSANQPKSLILMPAKREEKYGEIIST